MLEQVDQPFIAGFFACKDLVFPFLCELFGLLPLFAQNTGIVVHLLNPLPAELVRVQIPVGNVDQVEAVFRRLLLLCVGIEAPLQVVEVLREVVGVFEAARDQFFFEHPRV